jgi:hypothetical protein
MSVDLEREVRAALHGAADDLRLPPLDLTRIRRAGRRRRAGSTVFATLTVIIAAGALAGVVRIAAPGTGTDASARQSGTGAVAAATAAMANVQAFYSGYQTASKRGQAAVNTLIRARVASWYAPILQAPTQPGTGPVACGHQSSAAALSYQPEGEISGQLVFVVGSWWVGQGVAPAYNVVISDPATAKITGIACARTVGTISPSGTQHTASTLYNRYLTARRRGVPVHTELKNLLADGPAYGSAYMYQADLAAGEGALTYDPLVCTSSSLSPVGVIQLDKTLAGGTAGLALITPAGSRGFLGVVTWGRTGWTLADVACPRPTPTLALRVSIPPPIGFETVRVQAGAGAYRHGGS